jgi:DNA-binding MarR family transcriptional regulator
MLRELTVTTSMLHAQADRALGSLGQNLSRWQTLHRYSTEPTTVPQVAKALNQSRQYVQRLTDDMVRDGHVIAETNPNHQRSPLFRATAAGAALLDELELSVSSWTAFLADALSDHETDELRSTLAHLRRAAIEFGERAK